MEDSKNKSKNKYNTNDHNDDALILSKISALCSVCSRKEEEKGRRRRRRRQRKQQTHFMKSEALICSLLLWTRVKNDFLFLQVVAANDNIGDDHDDDSDENNPSDRQQQQQQQHSVLLEFCTRLVEQHVKELEEQREDDTHPRDFLSQHHHDHQHCRHPQQLQLSAVLVRLVTQLFTRIMQLQENNNNNEEEHENKSNNKNNKFTSRQQPQPPNDWTILQTQKWGNHLVRALIQILKLRRKTRTIPLEPLDLEILTAVQTYFLMSLLSSSSVNTDQDLWLHLWEIYQHVILVDHHPNNYRDHGLQQHQEDKTSNNTNDSEIMIATMQALLLLHDDDDDNQSSNNSSNNSSSSSMGFSPPIAATAHHQQQQQQWYYFCQSLLELFQHHQTLLFSFSCATKLFVLPSYWILALQWWLEEGQGHSKQPKRNNNILNHDHDKDSRKDEPSDPLLLKHRIQWAWLLLSCMMVNPDNDDHDNITLPVLEGSGSGNDHCRSWSLLVQLLMAVVVTPNQEIATLRPLAWTVTCRQWLRILNHVGLMDRHVCSLLRLAVGEWNIQLETILCRDHCRDHPKPIDPSLVDNNTEISISLLQACGNVVIQTVEWTTQAEHEVYNNNINTDLSLKGCHRLSKTCIQHVQSSLEQALNVCVQYLLHAQKEDTPNMTNESNRVVIVVLASLLTEFDVFTHGNKELTAEQMSASLTQALGQAMVLTLAMKNDCNNSSDSNRNNDPAILLPAATTVLASAQGDSKRVSLLSPWAQSFVGLVDMFWEQQGPASSKNMHASAGMNWIYPLMELIHDMFFPLAETTVATWKKKLMARLLHLLSDKGDTNDNENNQVLVCQGAAETETNAVISCYVTLQGDTPLSDNDEARWVLPAAISKIS